MELKTRSSKSITVTHSWMIGICWMKWTQPKKVEFDAIVANPPFSYRWEPTEEMGKDFRFNNYGLAPKSAADFAFLLHGFHFLKQDGTMAIILPHGVLFRGSRRTHSYKIAQRCNIDAVIGLPANLFFFNRYSCVYLGTQEMQKVRWCTLYQR